MNKILLLLILLFFSFGCHAQNWQCFKPGEQAYFVNKDHYLRASKVDSLKINGTDTIYYLYPTKRSNYYNKIIFDTAGGSWIGGIVTAQTNGDYLFKVRRGDLLTIKTQAHLGNTWTVYSDTLNIIFEASVISEDTMTIQASIDSIKKLTITAKQNSSILTNNPINGKEIILSKNHGIVQTIELYTFPYRDCGSLVYGNITDGYFTNANKNGLSDFHLTAMPTEQDLYNYDIGDILEFKQEVSQYPSYFTDTLISKSVMLDTVTYIFKRESRTRSAPAHEHTISFSNYSLKAIKKPIYTGIPELYSYSPYPIITETTFFEDTNTYCLNSPEFWLYYSNTASYYSKTMKIGVAITQTQSFSGQATTYTDLLYYKIKGVECGEYKFPESINTTQKVNELTLYPNPANEQLAIELNNKTSTVYSISLTDMFGKTILQLESNKEKETINTSTLPEGIYFVQVKSNSVSNTRKVIIRH